MLPNIQKVGFIGLGLIGGSVARAIRKYYPDCKITAFDNDRKALEFALENQIIHEAANGVDESFIDCDYIFLCVPVFYSITYLEILAKLVPPSCIITDVGSVKSNIHEAAKALNLSDRFIGGHPMTGSEKSGLANSKALLLENAYYVITPSEKISDEQIRRYTAIISSLKALPIVLDYQTHDYIAAIISHLPHIMASNLVNFVKDHDTKEEWMRMLAAGGFKDITRIASSSPTMWTHICGCNQDNIVRILDEYINMLSKTKEQIASSDMNALYEMFDTSKNYRDSISEGKIPLRGIHRIYCDLNDRVGELASILNTCVNGNINIRNLGIVHNREFEEGILWIEFYDDRSARSALTLLKKENHKIYEG